MEFTRHHVFFNRCEYKTPLQKMVRSLGVVVIENTVHKELHAKLAKPPMPNKNELAGLLMYTDGIKGIQRLELSCYYFEGAYKLYEAKEDVKGMDRARLITTNLIDQLGLIS